MVYIAHFNELNLQVCDYAQKRRICRENCKYALNENFHGHFCPRRKAAKFCHPVQCLSYHTELTEEWTNVFHVYLFHISFKAWKYTLYCRSWEIGNEPDISWYKLENYTKQTLFTKNLEAGWGRAQRYYGQFGLILTGGRSNTLWGRLGFENWLFTARLKIGCSPHSWGLLPFSNK